MKDQTKCPSYIKGRNFTLMCYSLSRLHQIVSNIVYYIYESVLRLSYLRLLLSNYFIISMLYLLLLLDYTDDGEGNKHTFKIFRTILTNINIYF